MATSDIHQPEALTRYALGESTNQESDTFSGHLADCAPCRRFVSFVRRFHGALQKGRAESPIAGESCPEPALIVALAAGELNQDVAKHVDAHLLFCRACRDEYYSACRMIEPEEKKTWKERFEDLKNLILDLGRTYGSGAMLGAIRIVAEGPAFAERGASAAPVATKIVEFTVAENRYRIELETRSDRSLSCDVTGYEILTTGSAQISVHSDAGEEIFFAQTDERGNCHFVLSADQVPQVPFVLTVSFAGHDGHLALTVP